MQYDRNNQPTDAELKEMKISRKTFDLWYNTMNDLWCCMHKLVLVDNRVCVDGAIKARLKSTNRTIAIKGFIMNAKWVRIEVAVNNVERLTLRIDKPQTNDNLNTILMLLMLICEQ